MSNSPYVTAKSISKVIPGPQTLFADLDFTIDSSELIGIYGSNGIGKTTLLRILSGAISPTSGEVVHSKSIERIGYAPASENNFFSRLSGKENLSFFSKLQKVDQKLFDSNVKKWSELPSFKKALSSYYFVCSSGMKQILNLFRAFNGSPNLVLLDEPLNHLDADSKKFIAQEVGSSLSSGACVIFTSHSKESFKTLNPKKYEIKRERLCFL